MNWMQKNKWGMFFKSVIWSVLIAFTAETFGFASLAHAQTYLQSLPVPGTMVNLSSSYTPILMKGIKTYPDNPFRFDFFIDPGQEGVDSQTVTKESSKLIKYFLASLTVPEDQLWVNLSPYEKDRIMPAGFGVTEMGRDLLAQDYFLKQMSASLLDPTTPRGEEFWKKIYAKIRKLGGDAGAVNTFNKVWIMPETADVYSKDGNAFVVNSHLKVMLEEDYVALSKQKDSAKSPVTGAGRAPARDEASNKYSAVIREVIVPALEKEVNEGENFAMLRQIFNSMILATWFKRHLRESVFGRMYVGQNKVGGVDVTDHDIKQKIYEQYLAAFQKGVFNFIREDVDPVTEESIPRKYFAGGVDFTNFGGLASSAVASPYHESSDIMSLRKVNLRPADFLGKPFYRVSSVVVSKAGVNWYSSLNRVTPAPVAEASSGLTAFNDSAFGAQLSSLFTVTTKKFSITRALGIGFATIALFSALGFSSDANAAKFSINEKHEMLVQMERGDNLSEVAKKLQKLQVEDMRVKADLLGGKFWGEGGVVEKLAAAMAISNPNDIKARATYVIPTEFLETMADGTDQGQSITIIKKTLVDTGVPFADTTAMAGSFDTLSKEEKPGQISLDNITVTEPAAATQAKAPALATPSAVSSPDGQRLPDGEMSLPSATLPPEYYKPDPTIPLTLGGLSLLALAALGRKYLLERTAKVFVTRKRVAEKNPSPAGALVKPEQLQTRAAQLLAKRMRSISLPYIQAQARVRDIVKERIAVLLTFFYDVLRNDPALWSSMNPQDREAEIEKTAAIFKEEMTTSLEVAGEMFLGRRGLNAMIATQADELVAGWAASGKNEFEDEASLDRFVTNTLNPFIEQRLRDFSQRLNSTDVVIVESSILSPLGWAKSLKKTGAKDLALRIVDEMLNDVATPLELPKASIHFASVVPLHREPMTVENVRSRIAQSPQLHSVTARLHEQALAMVAELRPRLVEAFISRRWSVKNPDLRPELAQSTTTTIAEYPEKERYAENVSQRFFEPLIVRYLDSAFDQAYAAGEIEDVINGFTTKLLKRSTGNPMTQADLIEIDNFIHAELAAAIKQRITAAAEALRDGVWSPDLIENIYQIVINKYVSREGAIANGSGIVLAPTAIKAAEEIAMILREDQGLFVVPVFVRAMAEELAESQVVEQEPVLAQTNEPVIPTESRAPPASYLKYDALVLGITAAGMIATGNTDLAGFLTTLASPFLFRGGFTASYWVHEFSHVVAGGDKALTKANLLGNIRGSEWLSMLIPLFGKVAPDAKVVVPGSKGWLSWFNRLAGLGTSTAILGLVGTMVWSSLKAGRLDEVFATLPLLFGALAVIVGSVKSDLVAPLQGRAKDCEFNCGVAAGVSEVDLRADFKAMGEVTDIRGQQAGGWDEQTVDRSGNVRWSGDRMVNNKRGDLPGSIDSRMAAQRAIAMAKGYSTPPGFNVLIGHYRYGTSSAPHKKETHPHHWMPERKVQVWSLDENGNLVERSKILGTTIVHNGDFDYWRFYGKYESNTDLSFWLERVLHTKNDTSGDSPKIAGMMDYLVTKGMWDASARFAYYEQGADSFDDVFNGKFEKVVTNQAAIDSDPDVVPEYDVTAPNTALTKEQLQQFAIRLSEVFKREGQKLVRTGDRNLTDLWSSDRMQERIALINDMLANLKGLDMVQEWDKAKRQRFVEEALKAFIFNDEYAAAKIFIERAKGSFGLAIGSTLKRGMILVADGQPLAIGMDEARTKLFAVSEPSALKISMKDGKTLDYRISLRQNLGSGEIVNISGPKNMKIYSRELGRELTPEEIDARKVSLRDNPWISELPDLKSDDPVGDDIRDTARVMVAIKAHWDDPASPNRQAERNILQLMVQKKIEKQIRQSSEAYTMLEVKMRKKADDMAFGVRRHLVAALQKKIASTRDWETALDLPKTSAQLSILLEGAVSAVWDRDQIEKAIREQAAQLARALMGNDIDANQSRMIIKAFISNSLDGMITEEHERVRSQIENVMSNWRETIAQDLILLSNRAVRTKSDLKAIGRMPIETLEKLWGEMGVKPGIPTVKNGMDLVVTGMEISQWVSEQFVTSLKQTFPDLRIVAETSNKVLEDPIAAGIDDATIVLAVSQSGQTFPTLNATIALEKLSPGRVFVLTGEWDTLMGQAVGQEFKKDSAPIGRIISNLTGFRPSEAVSLTGTATHVTLTELMLRLGEDMSTIFPNEKPLGLTLTPDGIAKLKEKRDVSITEMEQITGTDKDGKVVDSKESKALNNQAKKWARHVLDEPISKIITTGHLILAVVGGVLVFPLMAKLMPFAFAIPLSIIMQYFFFEFFKYTTIAIMRAVQGRSVLARTGKRTIVIGDRSYIHQALETFVSKLNSLSKSATAIDVHGANPGDHMVARFGHRVVRGSLIWLGVTDGRLGGKLEEWQNSIGMTGKQAKGVRSFGVGAEVIAVGRERTFNKNASDVDITIKGDVSDIPQDIAMLYEDRFDSLARLVSGQTFFYRMMRIVSTLDLSPGWRKFWPWAWKMNRTQSGPRIATTASPRSAPDYKRFIKQEPVELPLGMHARTGEAANDEDAAGKASSAIRPPTSQAVQKPDEAPGGIDLNPRNLKLNVNGNDSIPLPTAPAFMIDLQMINALPTDHFVPMIIEVVPIPTVEMFLGMDEQVPELASATR